MECDPTDVTEQLLDILLHQPAAFMRRNPGRCVRVVRGADGRAAAGEARSCSARWRGRHPGRTRATATRVGQYRHAHNPFELVTGARQYVPML